ALGVDRDRDIVARNQDELIDAEFASASVARVAKIDAFQARRSKHAAALADIDRRQALYEAQKSELAATLASDRRQEDALVLAEQAAQAERESTLRERAARSSSSRRLPVAGAASSAPAAALPAPRASSPPRPVKTAHAPTYATAAASS
ncbi:unnamed protein product, partial [Ectocarpus fasciculatus]